MSFDFHFDKPKYFNQQYLNSKEYLIPFIEKSKLIKPSMRILEIGCAEGGVLKAFVERDCICTGIELSASKIANAKLFMAKEIADGSISFICKNIYEVDFSDRFKHVFDIIILKDTIEHIHDQKKLIGHLDQLLAKNGVIFFGFPPWYMPWGGHQQICQSKFLMFLPYFHLLPTVVYKFILKIFNEPDYKIADLIEIKQTGISSSRFEKICKETNYQILGRQFFTINPIYKHKFGWKPRKQLNLISKIPVFRDLIATTVFYLVAKK